MIKKTYIIHLKNKSYKIGNKVPYSLCVHSYVKINIINFYYIIIYGGYGNIFSNHFIIFSFSNNTFNKSRHIINKESVNNNINKSVFLEE